MPFTNWITVWFNCLRLLPLQRHLMWIFRNWVLLFVLAVSVAPSSVVAQEAWATVRLDGRAVFRVTGTTTTDAAQRARQIEQRLTALVERPAAITPAQIEFDTADPTQRLVTVAAVPIVTVTTRDAEDQVTTVDEVASLWATNIDAALDRAIRQRLTTTGRLIVNIQSSVTAAFSRLLESAIIVVPRLIAGALIIGFFWLAATGILWVLRRVFAFQPIDPTAENLIRQVTYYAVWAVGLLVAADAFGFDTETVITGLGLTSLALGFALKDVISNFVSGVLLLTLRPFELGDQIVVGETEGSVERIELRATQIRAYDGRLVLVPNAEVFTSRIINNTASPIRRGSIDLYVGYSGDLETTSEVILRATRETVGVLETPPVSLRIRELGPSDIRAEARFWTDSRRADFLSTSSAVQERIVFALKEAAIALPDPAVRVVAFANSMLPTLPTADLKQDMTNQKT